MFSSASRSFGISEVLSVTIAVDKVLLLILKTAELKTGPPSGIPVMDPGYDYSTERMNW